MGKPLLAALALLCTFCAPQEKVAGGYDDVENPAIRASLLDTLGQPYGAGELRVYARYQNPGKDSLPVVERTVPAGTAAIITDSVLAAAMGEAKLRGTPWPNADTVEFNLSATASG